MFENLTQYKKIIVTGAQRSGTRIASKMIATDTEYDYLDERWIHDYRTNNPDSITKARFFLRNKSVLQAPSLASVINLLADDNTLIVYMLRPVVEVIASQERINWKREGYELSKYGLSTGVISQVKLETWQKQKLSVKNFLEIQYDSLSAHPLWIAEEERKDFKAWQTSL